MITARAIDAVAFDLDGTLVDSAPDIGHALNTGLREAGLRSFDLDTVRAWIGDGPDPLIARALQAQGRDPHDLALRRRLRAAFDATTLAAPLAQGKVYPGIAELLRLLAGRLPAVVVTNKPTALARAVLQGGGLLQHVQAVYGADTPELRKPAPALLRHAARDLGVPLPGLLLVGDGVADMGAARAAGCPAALVAWGYGQHLVSDEAGLWKVGTPDELLAGLLQRARCRIEFKH